MANTKLFDVMMEKLQPKSQLSLLNCQITKKLESVGSMFYEAKLSILIIDGCDIVKTDLNYIEGADQIVIKNSHLDDVKMAGIIANKVTFINNNKLNVYTSGKVDSVSIVSNKIVNLSAGFDTPSLVIDSNDFNSEFDGGEILVDGKVALADIKSCTSEGAISVNNTSIEKMFIRNCNMKGFRAFDATINNLQINNSRVDQFVTYSLNGNNFTFANSSLNQRAEAENVTIKNFDLSGLTLSPDLVYEDEAYELFHPGETPAESVVTE